MDKYQRLFIKQMRDKIKSITTSGQSSSETELYRLLHSAKGTAGTIGLDDWFHTASGLLERLEAESTRVWRNAEARELLAPLAFLLLNSADESEDTGEQSAIVEEPVVELPPYMGTLLIVDDDLSLLLVLKEHLERLGYMVLATPDAERALELFYSMKPDCVVLDIVLEERSGLDVLQEMQSRSEQYLIPVIVISTDRDRATRMRAYESGADDFMGKPFDVEEFAVRVKRQVSRRLKLNQLLMQDELTGAYNSTFFAQELVRHLQLQLERPEPATLTLFDLDSFRYINERFGYAEGDRLLKQFSDLVKPALGPQDIWARDRHDRFYLLQPGVGEKEASSFAHQLLERLDQDQTIGPDGYHLSFSAGILELKPGMTASSCYEHIMRIVSEAKRSREGVMVVPERRNTPAQNGQAVRLAEMALDAANASQEKSEQQTGNQAAPAGVNATTGQSETIHQQLGQQIADEKVAASAADSHLHLDTDVSLAQTELPSEKMDGLLSSLSSRLKRHQRVEPEPANDAWETTGSKESSPVLENQPEMQTAISSETEQSFSEPPSTLQPTSEMMEPEASPAPVFQPDTIRKVESRDGTDSRLEWVDRAEKALLSQQTAEIQQAPVPPVDVDTWRLAIIDDDDLIRNMLTKRLSALQAEHELDIRSFSDGEDFFTDPWHGEDAKYLLILDRMMPRMNGMEVLRRLRSSDKRNRYMVLMLTGVGDDREVADAISAGTDDYLTKPFSMVELEARIRRLLGRMKA